MKTIEEILERVTRCDMSYSMRQAADAGAIIQIYREQIENFMSLCPDTDLTVSGHSIELEYCNDRAILMKFLQCFGGDFDKVVNDYDKTKMDYVQTHLHPMRDKSKDFEEVESVNEETGEVKTEMVPYKYQRKFTIAAKSVTPPPSCKIVEEEVEIPARKEIRKKIVCKEEPTAEVEEVQAQ